MTYFCATVFAVLICSHLSVASTSQIVFTIDRSDENARLTADFNVSMFEEFYRCLCNSLTRSCAVTIGSDNKVTQIKRCTGIDANQQSYECVIIGVPSDIVCTMAGSTDYQRTCEPQDDTPFCDLVTLKWSGSQQVNGTSFSDDITVPECDGNCYSIRATDPISPPRSELTTQTTTLAAVITQPSSSTSGQQGSTNTITKSDNDKDNNDNMAIIIGAAVGGAVFVVIVITIIIIIVLRRRIQKASSSLTTTTTTTTTTTITTTTTTNKDDDTDIYPYADSSFGNVGPNLTFNNLNSNSNDPTPVTYATMDPSKKLNKKKTSLGTNNVNDNKDNKSKINKTQLRQNLGYTEVDKNNDADFPQSSSVANKGQRTASSSQVLPSPPPDPTVKPKYYNTFGETGEDPSAAYAQVVKKNKNKDERAVKGKGAGSNPTRDPSGYEEAVPRTDTDTQYAEVNLSAKTKPKPHPALGGGFAKLHDPIR